MSSPAARQRAIKQQQLEELNINDRRVSEQERDEEENLDPILQNDQQLRNELNIARSPGHNEMDEKDFEEYNLRRAYHNSKRITNNDIDNNVKKNVRGRVKSLLETTLHEYETQLLSLYNIYQLSIPTITIDNIILKSNIIAVDFVYNYLVRNNIPMDDNEEAIKELVDNIFFSTLTTILEGYKYQNVNKTIILTRLTNMFNESTFKINKTELTQLVNSNISVGKSFKSADNNIGKTVRWQGGKSRRTHKRKQSKKVKRRNTKKNKKRCVKR